MATPVVSVLMTAYNREKYIAEAIESVLAQTFTDFELIVVDDGSQDATVEIAQRYTIDPRVQVYVSAKNLGDYANRNRAASLARGEYLKYLDSDDVLYSHGLEVMVKVMRQFPTAALGLQRPDMNDQPYPVILSPEQALREHFLMGGMLGEGPSGTIILASAFRRVGGFSGRQFMGDVEMWLKLATHYPVVKLMRGLVWWRRHDAQEISTERDAFPYGTAAYPICREALSAMDCPLSVQEREHALRWYKHRQARCILRIALRDRCPGKALRVMHETGIALGELRLAFAPPNKLRAA